MKDKCFFISTGFTPERFILRGRAEWNIQDGVLCRTLGHPVK
jgi:hypothetical protein